MNAVAKLSHDQPYLTVNHNESVFTVIDQILKSDIGILETANTKNDLLKF